MRVYHIPRTSVPDWFEDCRAYIEAALLLHPFLTVDEVRYLCESGPFVLTVVISDEGTVAGCFVTEMLIFPKRRVVNIVFMGGSKGFLVQGLDEGLQTIEQEATRVGASAVCGAGRPGLSRVIRSKGYRSRATSFVWKELDHANEGRRQPESEPIAVGGGAPVHC